MELLKVVCVCVVLLACRAEGAQAPVAPANAPDIAIRYDTFPGCTFLQDTLIERDEDFSTLKEALAATGLNDTLATLQQTITVFAPTNEAFGKAAALLNTTLPALLSNPALSSLLLYHASPVVLPELSQFYSGESFDTLLAGAANLTALVVNNTVGIMSFGSEGVLLEGYGEACKIAYYVIDEVLLPESFLFANSTLYYYLANSLLSNATLVPTNVVTTAVAKGLTYEVAAALADAQFNGATKAVTGLCRAVASANATNTTAPPITAILESLAQNFTCSAVLPCARGALAANVISKSGNYSSALKSCLSGLFPAPVPAPVASPPVATAAPTAVPTAAVTPAAASPAASPYVVNGPQGPCSCTLGPPGSYNPAMTNPNLSQALQALGTTRCPIQSDGNIGIGNTGGAGNVGCYNTGTGNNGDSNTGTGNVGANNDGTGNIGFGLSGTGSGTPLGTTGTATGTAASPPPPATPTPTVTSQAGYVVNGPQGPCACTLGPPGSYNPAMTNPTLAQALVALGPTKCPQQADGNIGVGNTGGSANTGCYNTGSANSGDNNSGNGNNGANNSGNGNTGFSLTGNGLASTATSG